MLGQASDSTEAALSPRHNALVEQLETLVRRNGFGDLGIGEIARELRCSRSTLYAIAPSKEQLFLLVVDRLFRDIESAAEAAAEREREPAPRVEAFLAAGLEEVRGIAPRLIDEIAAHPAGRIRMAEFQRSSSGKLRVLIEEGIAAGVFHPVNATLAAELLDATVTRIQEARLLRETGLGPSDALADVFRIITHGLMK